MTHWITTVICFTMAAINIPFFPNSNNIFSAVACACMGSVCLVFALTQ